MEWTKEYQHELLNKFFSECLRFWERELNVDSDLDNAAYIRAIEDIPVSDPYCYKNARTFDKDVVYHFARSRCMDCYGKNWGFPFAGWKRGYDLKIKRG